MSEIKKTSSAFQSCEASTAIEVVSRRNFLAGGASCATSLALLFSGSATALAQSGKRSEQYEKAIADLLKGATPTAEMITLKMPEIAENGNVVSISIDASAAEASGKIVRAIHVFATDNPWPFVATFQLSELSGKALVTTRMRLARSQKVVAIADIGSGAFLITETFVKVTIGGCGG